MLKRKMMTLMVIGMVMLETGCAGSDFTVSDLISKNDESVAVTEIEQEKTDQTGSVTEEKAEKFEHAETIAEEPETEEQEYVLPEGYIPLYKDINGTNWQTSLMTVEPNEDGTYTATWSWIGISDVLAVTQEEFDAIHVGDRLPVGITELAPYYESLICVSDDSDKYFVSDYYSSVEAANGDSEDSYKLVRNIRINDGRIPLQGTFYAANDRNYHTCYGMDKTYQDAKMIIAENATIQYRAKDESGAYGTTRVPFKDFYENNLMSNCGNGWRGTGMIRIEGDREGRIISIQDSEIKG